LPRSFFLLDGPRMGHAAEKAHIFQVSRVLPVICPALRLVGEGCNVQTDAHIDAFLSKVEAEECIYTPSW
jgi:hypothetical protein